MLTGLRKDPTLVAQLYGQLFDAKYFSLVRKGTEHSLSATEFLTYNAKDGIKELPLFTADKFIISNLPHQTMAIQLGGRLFWTRLLDVVETGKCEVAIDPGQPHGIRLTKEMILGMIATH